VARPEFAEHGLKVAAAAIGERVIGHHRLGPAGALVAHPRSGATQRDRRGLAAVGAVQLDVGQARMVINDAVRVDIAGAPVAREFAAIACRPVPRHAKALQALGVHVQQRPRLRPLIAAKRPFPRRPAPPRSTVAGQHL
jgi:hypothetical protein